MAGEMSPPVVVRSGGAPGTLLFPPSYTGPFSPVAVAKVEGQEYACKCRPGSEHAFILCPGFARTQSGALHPSFAHLTSHHPASSPPISILAVPLLQQGGGGGGGNGMKTRPSAATVRPVVVLMTDGRRRGRELNPIERLQVIQAVQHLPVCEGFEYDCGMEIVRVAEVRNAKSACIVIDASVTVTVKTIGKGEWDDGREGSCGGGVEGYEQMAVATTSTADRHTAKSRLGGVDHLLSLFVDAFKLMEMGGMGPRGFLLRGPPGTGKTALVREVASQLRTNVVIIEGAVIAGMQAGLAEAMLKRKLDDTKVHASCLLFIDEIDILCAKREGKAHTHARLVSILLTFMDGVGQRDRKCLVVGATNRPDAIDPAIRRGGRLEREVDMPVPNERQRVEIMRALLGQYRVSVEADVEDVAKIMRGYVGADVEAVVRSAVAEEMEKERGGKGHSEGTVVISSEALRRAVRKYVPSTLRSRTFEMRHTSAEELGGMGEKLSEMRKALLWPYTKEKEYTRFKLKQTTGILLLGPPGVGKTAVVRALAAESGLPLLLLRPSDIMSPYLGETEASLRSAFKTARASSPSILFFDEIDTLCGGRERGSDVSARILSTLLNEMDGINSGGSVIVIGATNRPDVLDDALVRPGRLEKHIHFTLPSQSERRDIFAVRLNGIDVDEDVVHSLDELARITPGFSGAMIAQACQQGAMGAVRRGKDRIGVDDLRTAVLHLSSRRDTSKEN